MSYPPVKDASPRSASEESGGAAGDTGAYETWLCRAARVGEPHPVTRLPVPGQVIAGKYRIETELGRGGMGAVFRARHLATERMVALKWTLRSATERQSGRRHFREARAVGRVSHPNVVDVYDAGQEDDAGYLVMELLQGETLRARLGRGPLGAQAAVDLLVPAMRGVAAANRMGIIHRDIKPDNLFIAKAADGTETIKTLDFGVSAMDDPSAEGDARPRGMGVARAEAALEPGTTTLTRQGSVLGTPAYMSPEQVDNPASCDARTDVYAFGVVLYECIAGRRPFEGTERRAEGTPSHAPPAMGSAAPLCLCADGSTSAQALESVLAKALAADLQSRFGDLDALVEALAELDLRPMGVTTESLGRASDGVSQGPGPLSLAARAGRPSSGRFRVWAAPLAAAALVSLAAWASWAATTAAPRGAETPSVAEVAAAAAGTDGPSARQPSPRAVVNDPRVVHAPVVTSGPAEAVLAPPHREPSADSSSPPPPRDPAPRQLARRAPNGLRPQTKVESDLKLRTARVNKSPGSPVAAAASAARAGAIHLEDL